MGRLARGSFSTFFPLCVGLMPASVACTPLSPLRSGCKMTPLPPRPFVGMSAALVSFHDLSETVSRPHLSLIGKAAIMVSFPLSLIPATPFPAIPRGFMLVGLMRSPLPVSYTHLTLPTNREV